MTNYLEPHFAAPAAKANYLNATRVRRRPSPQPAAPALASASLSSLFRSDPAIASAEAAMSRETATARPP
jgi:hypothetical protein